MQKNLEKNYAEVLNLKRHYSLTDAVAIHNSWQAWLNAPPYKMATTTTVHRLTSSLPHVHPV